MREIKFRAWNKYMKRMEPTQKFNSKEYPIMQFTGKKDRNGDPVYEGDIIEQHGDPSQRYPVSWDDYAAAFVMMGRHGGEPDFLGDFNTSYIKIVGNIYEPANVDTIADRMREQLAEIEGGGK